MMGEMTDEELAEDLAAQLKIIADGYETGKAVAIDNALNRITHVRRMKSNGIHDLIASHSSGSKSK